MATYEVSLCRDSATWPSNCALGLCAAYQSQAAERPAETARELAQAITAFGRPTNAVAIETLGREIEDLRKCLQPLDERVRDRRSELARLEAAIAAARRLWPATVTGKRHRR
jgi:hypothetical protein